MTICSLPIRSFTQSLPECMLSGTRQAIAVLTQARLKVCKHRAAPSHWNRSADAGAGLTSPLHNGGYVLDIHVRLMHIHTLSLRHACLNPDQGLKVQQLAAETARKRRALAVSVAMHAQLALSTPCRDATRCFATIGTSLKCQLDCRAEQKLGTTRPHPVDGSQVVATKQIAIHAPGRKDASFGQEGSPRCWWPDILTNSFLAYSPRAPVSEGDRHSHLSYRLCRDEDGHERASKRQRTAPSQGEGPGDGPVSTARSGLLAVAA